jgi:hypothetical protein
LVAAKAPAPLDFTSIAVRRGNPTGTLECTVARVQSRVSAWVERVFGAAKRLCGFGKARRLGLAKAGARRLVATSLANAIPARMHLAALARS